MQYKALLEAAECNDLETAVRLAEETDEYELDPEPEIQEEIEYDTLENYAVTSYGNLRRKDNGPLQFEQNASSQTMQI